MRQLKEDIDIEARLVAGVPAVKAPARRHPHVANQHGSHSFIVHLITQALNKLNQIRMTEVATLIGTHHLIAGGTQGSASAPTIQPLENAPIDWALPPIGWVIFCHGVAAATGASQQRKQCDNGVFHGYQRGIVVVTSPFCAR